MRSAKVPALSLVILAISVILVMPASAEGSDVAAGDVGLVPYFGHLEINAGSSDSFRIEVVNYLSFAENDISDYRMVTVSFITDPDIYAYVENEEGSFVLMGQEFRSVTVHVDVDKYASADEYEIGIVLTATTLVEGGGTVTAAPVNVGLTVLSPLSSGDAYNKILGLFSNPFPDPFNTPLATAVITFLLWLIIGILAVLTLLPILLRLVARNHKEEGDKLKKGLRTLLPPVILLFAFDSALRVFGADKHLIGPVEVWFNVFYIALGALIAWKIYIILVQYLISRLARNRRVDQSDIDVEPLLRLLGQLVIAVAAVAMIMSALGFNLTAIITSAGIVSLGITLGAQNVLNQFFSGMVLLITRPFKSGDLVKIGAGSTIYKVSSVNIMNTVFDNWDNEETVIMPNNMVSSSAITNLTGDGLLYKIKVFMNIGYDDNIDLAKNIMEKIANDHPSVMTNGAVDPPSTRVTAFLDSSIEVRLTCYVYDFNDNGKIGGELRESIFKAFKENGINVPYPQRDVHIVSGGPQEENDD